MGSSKGNSSYRYALLGIVGLVALVSIFTIFRATGPLHLGFPTKTSAGQATAITSSPPVPPGVGFNMREGETTTVNVGGVDYEVTLYVIIPPDENPKSAIIATVNGEYTYKIYSGNKKVLHGVSLTLERVETGVAYLTLRQTSEVPIDDNPGNIQGVPDTLREGETKLYTINGRDFEVTLSAVTAKPSVATAKFNINGVMTRAGKVGDTVLGDGATITVREIARSPTSPFLASFTLSADPHTCGPVDGQTPYCRGASACCGGSCTELPDCSSRGDGPALNCGQRQMFCCDQKLSFEACATEVPPSPPPFIAEPPISNTATEPAMAVLTGDIQ